MPLPPLSLYVHIPWCVRKCPYCDFNSHESKSIPEQAYVKVLLQDLAQDCAMAQGRPLQSIFFGGGTPSLFSSDAINQILRGAERYIGFAEDIEITLEANPGTAEFGHLEGYRAAGVNRLSFGIQSFNDDHLQRLGRIHSGGEALRAFDLARNAGFTNINLDLMHGLPQQSAEQAQADLHQALALAPEHLSWYQLTIEPNTVFYTTMPNLPDDDILCDIQEQGQQLLEDHGYGQYEVSAYSRAGLRSKHNLNYWEFGDYLAIGAGAHGKITFPDGAIQRFRKTRKPDDYLRKQPTTAASDWVPQNKQLLEFMMNALRLRDGVPRALLHQRTQLSDAVLVEPLALLVAKGLLLDSQDRLQPTALGYRFLNDTLNHFGD